METLQSEIRAKIMDALRAGNSSIPDRNLFVGEINDCINVLEHVITKDVAFLDVPLKSIVRVNHDNPALSASVEQRTWRSIMGGINADGWTQAQIDYMESAIGEREFNAPGSRRLLELSSVGGAVACDNGLHRLAAAACWLSSKPGGNGDDPVLRKVPVRIWTLPPQVQNLFTSASRGQWDVFVARPNRSVMMKFVDASKQMVCTIDRDGIKEIEKPKHESFITKMFGSPDPRAAAIDWIAVPALLRDAIADNRWYTKQKDTPLYLDRPQQVTLAVSPGTRKQFSGMWSETVFENDGTRVIDEGFFTELHGYNDEDRRGIAALKVGETWQSDPYAESHTVTRLPDAKPADKATDDESAPSTRQRMRP